MAVVLPDSGCAAGFRCAATSIPEGTRHASLHVGSTWLVFMNEHFECIWLLLSSEPRSVPTFKTYSSYREAGISPCTLSSINDREGKLGRSPPVASQFSLNTQRELVL